MNILYAIQIFGFNIYDLIDWTNFLVKELFLYFIFLIN